MKFLIECDDYSEEFSIPEGSTIIGSGGGSRMLLEFPGVESRHAQCYWDGSRRIVLKSLGGTIRVNGEETDRARLSPYDEVRIGDVKMTFLLEANPQDAPQSSDAGESGEATPTAESSGVEFDDAPDDSQRNLVPAKSRDLASSGEGRPTELIQRGERWILRDLVTNREVEISPIEAQSHGAEAQVQPEEVTATPVSRIRSSRHRKASRLPIVIIVVVAIGVTLAAMRMGRDDSLGPAKTLQEDYERQIRIGFAWIKKDKPEEAIPRLQSAHKIIPESRLVEILRDIADLESNRGAAYESYRWALAGQLYEELAKNGDASSDMREYATERGKFVLSHRIHAGVMKEARELYAKGEFVPAELNVRKIPADSLIREQYKEWILKCRQESFNTLLAQVEQSVNSQKWDTAHQFGKMAEEINPDSERLSEFLALSKRSKIAKTQLATAQELLDSGRRLRERPGDATSVLQQAALQLKTEEGYVFEGTAYAKESVETLQQIQQLIESLSAEEQVQTAMKLFQEGKGPQALEYLSKQKNLSSTALSLQRRIKEVLALEEKTAEYEKEKQYEGARDSWRKLARITEDGGAYNARALAMLDFYKERAGAIAQEYRNIAISVQDDHPQRARTLLKAALAWKADYEEAQKLIDALDRKATLEYRLGYTKREQSVGEAIRHFQTAARYAEENSELSIKAIRELRKLQPD